MTGAGTTMAAPLSADERTTYQARGFHVVRGLFTRAEVQGMARHYEALHARAPLWELYTPQPTSPDPLQRYPRIMQPHRWDQASRRWLLDARTLTVLAALMEDEPVAAQSMFYFKPPGADGQAFHQDNFYLMAHPGTCYAAWLAVDDADAGNGALYVLPGSHHAPLVTPAAGTADAWGNLVPQPTVDRCLEVRLAAGDCLFFPGALVHGSLANTSATRWRRSFICHYVPRRRTRQVAAYYHPLMDGSGAVVAMDAGLEPPPGPAR